MPKTKQQKQETIQSLTDGLRNSKSVVFANFQGLKVSESEELRKTAIKEKVNVLATKKTLLKRAFDQAGLSGADPLVFPGGVAAFMGEDEISAAKVVQNFAKKHEVVEIYGGVLEGKFINQTMVKSLAALPGKKEMLGRLVSALQAPISGFVNALAGNIRNLVTVLRNAQEAKGKA